MSWVRAIRGVLVSWATLGVIWPGTGLSGGETEHVSRLADHRVPDVRLDAGGQLQGMVVDGQGHGLPEAQVVVSRVGDSPRQVTKTDADGRFTVGNLKGGTYCLRVSEGTSLCRVWTPGAAPPSAAHSILVVNDRLIQRGQRPIRELFVSDPILVATLVTAAIAIPIAVHKSRDDTPPGS